MLLRRKDATIADNSLYHIPENADEEALVMLSDILPTGFECGVSEWTGKAW